MAFLSSPRLALTPQERRIVVQIVSTHAPMHRVKVFGSRAQATPKVHKPRASADLDLLFEGERALTLNECGNLRHAFEESDLPFTVDVVDAAGLNAAFRRSIDPQLTVLVGG